MTPFSGGGRLRAFHLSFTQNRLLMILLAMLLPVLVGLNILSALQFNGRYHLPWTLADQLCQTTLPPVFLFIVAVPFVYLVCHEIKYGFSAPVILRYPNKSALWRHQTAQIAVSALLVSLYLYLSVLSVGKTLGLGTINWDSAVSAYYARTQTFNTQDSLLTVSLLFILSSFIGLLSSGVILLWFRWITGRFLPGFICLLTIGAMDIVGIPLLYSRLGLEHRRWLRTQQLGGDLLLCLLVTVMLIAAGSIYARRKDFLHEQQ